MFFYININDDTNIATTATNINITITFLNFSFMKTPHTNYTIKYIFLEYFLLCKILFYR